jgi:hypothetical protein
MRSVEDGRAEWVLDLTDFDFPWLFLCDDGRLCVAPARAGSHFALWSIDAAGGPVESIEAASLGLADGSFLVGTSPGRQLWTDAGTGELVQTVGVVGDGPAPVPSPIAGYQDPNGNGWMTERSGTGWLVWFGSPDPGLGGVGYIDDDGAVKWWHVGLSPCVHAAVGYDVLCQVEGDDDGDGLPTYRPLVGVDLASGTTTWEMSLSDDNSDLWRLASTDPALRRGHPLRYRVHRLQCPLLLGAS